MAASKNFVSLIPYQTLVVSTTSIVNNILKKNAFQQYFPLLIIFYDSELFPIVVFTYLAKENQGEFHESHTFVYSALV